ncbi:MAG TPA: GTPase HflX [Planctomycetota bacterium]|nr:GTPase HflX [Planctomycetota bacterium]
MIDTRPAEPLRSELSVRLEHVVLSGAVLPDMQHDHDEPLSELEQLAETAGARVVGKLDQKTRTIEPAYCIGRGKAEMLAAMVDELDADSVIFDNDLTPAQIRNLERLIGRKVLDRSELILDIFASHARTHQARLQVELAQLEYTMPRLQRMWSHLGNIEGGIGTRGPGERQLETDRRLARRRAVQLRKEISQIIDRKAREVRSRSDEFTVSLVGYTNAGKSTLMNALTGAGVLVEDKLFATLDTCTRVWPIGAHRKALLSDTVGFIRHLPHHLVASFHATLEEATQADLLLHVVDASHPECESQIKAVEAVLSEIGCSGKPCVVVFNKIDAVIEHSCVTRLRMDYPASIEVSARSGQGLDELTAMVAQSAADRDVLVHVETHCGNGRLFAYLAEHGRVTAREYAGDAVRLSAAIPPRHLGQLRKLAGGKVDVERMMNDE